MKEEILKKLYLFVNSHRLSGREKIAESLGLDVGAVLEGLEILCDAGLLAEHFTAGNDTYSSTGVYFAVLDASGGEWYGKFYSEKRSVKETVTYFPNPVLNLYENLRCFYSEVKRNERYAKTMSVCIIPPEGYDRELGREILPEYVAVTGKTPDDAALSMRERYFSVRLAKYNKKNT